MMKAAELKSGFPAFLQLVAVDVTKQIAIV